MFNLFKKKIELKNEKCIMSTVNNKKSFKIGSEIIVPDNFECLIYHKGKLYNTLTCGKHKLDKSTFATLIDTQQTAKFKNKYIKFISHYISISKQELVIKFKRQKFAINFHVDNSPKFAELMLLYTYKVDNDYAVSYLLDIFKELLIFHKGNYKSISNNSLTKYGIMIDSFLPISGKSSIFQNSSTNQATINNTTLENNNLTTNTNNTSPSQATINPTPNLNQIKFPTCPKCGNSVKFKTTYCLRCGYKLDD